MRAACQPRVHCPEGRRHARTKRFEKRFVQRQLTAPCIGIDACDSLERLGTEVQTMPVDVAILRHDAEQSVLATGAALGTAKDPFQYPHVFAKAGPQKTAVVVGLEPV